MGLSISAVDLEKGVRASLAERMVTQNQFMVSELCDVIDIQADDLKHGYLSDAPQMSEFEASRKVTSLIDKSTTITNKVYDAAMQFRRDDLRRSQAGMINLARAQQRLVNTVAGFPNKRLTELTVNGTTAVATSGENTPYDGQPFFSNSHPALADEGGTQDNLAAGTGTTTAQVSTDINSVVSTFYNFKGTNGEPFFGDTDLDILFMIPPALMKSFREALEATIISNTSNVQSGIGRLFINPRLTGTDVNDWYAFVTNPGFKPYAWQRDQPMEVDATAEGSDMWKRDRRGEVGVSAALGAGYLYWQSAIKVVNS
jgi:phage major head subunit gpT-like protein